MASMRRSVWEAPGAIGLETAERPIPKEGEVLIRTGGVGICGTDVSIFRGNHPIARPPLVLGHEACGTVVDTGPAVAAVGPGDRVVVDPKQSCGQCPSCRKGSYYQCTFAGTIGVQADGAYADFFLIPARNCFRMPEGMSWEQGALVDTLACALNGMNKADQLWGKTVAILGAGLSAYCFCQLAKLDGAAKVILTGTTDERLKLGRKMGVDVTINACDENVVERIREETDGLGVDLLVDSSGSAQAIRDGILITRTQGTIILYGVFTEPVDALSLRDIQYRELRVLGSAGAPWTYDAAIDLITSGRIDLNPIVTHTFSLDELAKAFEMAEGEERRYVKGVVLF